MYIYIDINHRFCRAWHVTPDCVCRAVHIYKYKYSDLFTYIPMSPTIFKATSSIQILASPFM